MEALLMLLMSALSWSTSHESSKLVVLAGCWSCGWQRLHRLHDHRDFLLDHSQRNFNRCNFWSDRRRQFRDMDWISKRKRGRRWFRGRRVDCDLSDGYGCDGLDLPLRHPRRLQREVQPVPVLRHLVRRNRGFWFSASSRLDHLGS